MTVFGCPVTCPNCAGDLELVNATPGFGVRALSIVSCPVCDREYEIRAYLHPLPTRQLSGARQRRQAREKAA